MATFMGTQDKNQTKQKYNTTQKILKISNTDPTQIRGEPIHDDVRC